MDLVFGLIIIALAPVISLAIRRIRPLWPPFKIGWVSALILPAMIVALCIFVFVSASMAGPERCAGNACKAAMAMALVMAVAAAVEFLLGWLATLYFQRWLARR
ncbi:hypothetical protein [Sphingomonas sp. GB1N7]|uniref:hypothetical protein n=1 Tax=Parasphingomonas caseinilytica TaxID=3096158 RepID=UPI002FCAB1F7